MLMRKLLARFYQDQATDGDTTKSTGGDTKTTDTKADTKVDTKVDTKTDTKADTKADTKVDGKGDKSLLETLGKGDTKDDTTKTDTKDDGKLSAEQKALAAADKDTRRPKEVPAKYWDAEKGEVKYAAWAKSTTELETRMRDIGLPPKDAAEYKFELPKEMKDLGIDLDAKSVVEFRKMAHEIGLTQKQFERVMAFDAARMPQLADQVSQFSEAKARTDLLAYYKTEEALVKNVKAAFNAFSAYADEADMALINQLGNIPAVVKILAKVGAEMAEDPGVNPEAILDSESLEQLMRGGPGKDDSPYWNTSDPRHKATVAKVTRHHEATAKSQQRRAA